MTNTKRIVATIVLSLLALIGLPLCSMASQAQATYPQAIESSRFHDDVQADLDRTWTDVEQAYAVAVPAGCEADLLGSEYTLGTTAEVAGQAHAASHLPELKGLHWGFSNGPGCKG